MLSQLLKLEPQVTTIAFPRGRLAFRAMPASGGIEQVTSPSYSWNGLKRGLTPFVVIQHTVAGEGGLTYAGRHLRVGAGETMLVTIPHEHRYFLPAGGSWSFFYLVLTGQEILRLCREVIATAGPVLRLSPRALDRLAACLLALLGGTADTPGEASSIAYRAAMALADDLAGITAPPGDEPQPVWFSQTIARISDNLGESLTVDRLAETAGLSRAHFVRQFARLAGSPPSEFVFSARMARAARLLQSSEVSILEISRALGFSDPNYFAKAFRRAFNVSPTEFRGSGLFTATDVHPGPRPSTGSG
ncbi:MAG TPA: AraC family transcriptional regulator [Devosiaceae bacterium]|nr:AraC family transcriptional regulator [Devosiaceae bacterium]